MLWNLLSCAYFITIYKLVFELFGNHFIHLYSIKVGTSIHNCIALKQWLHFHYYEFEFSRLFFRGEKRGYNPLKVENLVHLPPQVDPTDPLFQHQWYLVRRFICGGIFFENFVKIIYYLFFGRKTQVKMVENLSWI